MHLRLLIWKSNCHLINLTANSLHNRVLVGSVVNLLLFLEHLMRLNVNAINHRSTTSPVPFLTSDPSAPNFNLQHDRRNPTPIIRAVIRSQEGLIKPTTAYDPNELPPISKTALTPHQNGGSCRLRLTRLDLARLPPHQTRHPLYHQR